MSLNELEKMFNSSYTESKNIDKSISLLKENGVSMMKAVKIVRSELKISLREADEIVLNSTAFKSNKESTEDFRNNFWDVVESQKEKGIPPRE